MTGVITRNTFSSLSALVNVVPPEMQNPLFYKPLLCSGTLLVLPKSSYDYKQSILGNPVEKHKPMRRRENNSKILLVITSDLEATSFCFEGLRCTWMA